MVTDVKPVQFSKALGASTSKVTELGMVTDFKPEPKHTLRNNNQRLLIRHVQC